MAVQQGCGHEKADHSGWQDPGYSPDGSHSNWHRPVSVAQGKRSRFTSGLKHCFNIQQMNPGDLIGLYTYSAMKAWGPRGCFCDYQLMILPGVVGRVAIHQRLPGYLGDDLTPGDSFATCGPVSWLISEKGHYD